jgi:transcriptional regulator with XRE-family HTH domain
MYNIKDKELANTIGKNIKKVRKFLGMSQRSLSQKTGISNTLISKWESCNVLPSIRNMVKLAKGLNVKVDRLVTEEVEK